MEQIIAIAPARIGRADPDRISRIDILVDAPRHFSISWQTHLPGQIHLPAFIG
jgi:hypothetical protein